MKVKLISPAYVDEKRRGMQGKVFQLPPFSLAAVAAATPDDVEVQIIDESIEPIFYESDCDLVGITVLTRFAPHAYEIAQRFREKGVKVVLGGMHPSAVPEEAINYANSVVIGEAENVWELLLNDFKQNKLKKFYKSETYPDLSKISPPRRDLFKKNRYFFTNIVQTTRGCPFNCNFCSLTKFFGVKYRTRPVESIVNEVKNLNTNFIGFLDDNIFGNPTYSKKLLSALKKENINWISQGSLNIVKDPGLLKLTAQSGCRGLFVGLESADPESLIQMNKKFLKPSAFKEAIDKLHDVGISVLGAFVLGNDNEDESIFQRTLEFAKKIKIDLAQFSVLTPFPGTNLYNKLIKENRIFDFNWEKYTCGTPVFKPLKMTVSKLKEGTNKLWRDFYRTNQVLLRLIKLGKRLPLQFLPLLIINHSFRKEITATQNL
jgi:radical SAM superfamily enzyme YgiQ (UPF0313 family)